VLGSGAAFPPADMSRPARARRPADGEDQCVARVTPLGYWVTQLSPPLPLGSRSRSRRALLPYSSLAHTLSPGRRPRTVRLTSRTTRRARVSGPPLRPSIATQQPRKQACWARLLHAAGVVAFTYHTGRPAGRAHQ
jgi:hypothetical protein